MELLRDFPDAPTNSLAKKAWKENPVYWPSQNACVCMFRNLRGQQGERNRAKTIQKDHFREASECTGFEKLPEGIEQLEDWQHVQIDTPGTWLVLSDIHIPFHSKEVLQAVLKHAKTRQKIAGVLLNGDVADCFSVSHWQKDPRKRNLPNELKTVRTFFEALRDEFPKSRIVWKFGNHEERHEIFLRLKAPEFLGVPEFDLAALTHAADYGIEDVRNMQPIKLGKLYVLHGHEYKFNISNPVNPARGLFLRARVSALCGHMHQSSSHTEKDLAEHETTCWSTGALCNLTYDYAPLNKHNHGFAVVDVWQDGGYEVDNLRIIKGRACR
jgi:predicted phosphodiesterase